MRCEFFEQRFRCHSARGTDVVGSTGGETACARCIATESALRGIEFLQFVRCEKVNLAVVIDVASVARNGGTNLAFVGTAGFERNREIETVARFDGVANDLGFAEMCSVFLEVWRELGVELFAQPCSVSGQEVEGFVTIAEPPTSRGRIERETSGLEQLKRGGVRSRFA